jgi:hypothetical protein
MPPRASSSTSQRSSGLYSGMPLSSRSKKPNSMVLRKMRRTWSSPVRSRCVAVGVRVVVRIVVIPAAQIHARRWLPSHIAKWFE